MNNVSVINFNRVFAKIKENVKYTFSIVFSVVALLPVSSNAQELTQDEIIKYIHDNLNSPNTTIVEEDGIAKIEYLNHGIDWSAPIDKLDKESISIRKENPIRSRISIKCKRDESAVKMSETEELPRKDCVSRKDMGPGSEKVLGTGPTDYIWMRISIGNTGSKEGAIKAFRRLIEINNDTRKVKSKSEKYNGSKEDKVIEVGMRGNLMESTVTLNGVVTIKMIIDSGASEVSISPDVASTIVRSGTVEEDDWLDSRTYVFADGSRAKSKRFNLDTIKIGSHTIRNVAVSISNDIESPLLLGQNVLSRLGEVTFDYENSRIIIE